MTCVVVERLVNKCERVRRCFGLIYGRKNENITVDGNVKIKYDNVININDNVNFRLCRFNVLRGFALFNNRDDVGTKEKRLRNRLGERTGDLGEFPSKKTTRLCVFNRFLLANIIRINRVFKINRIILGKAE